MLSEAQRLKKALRQAFEYADEYMNAEVRADDRARDAGKPISHPDRITALHGCRVARDIRDIIGELQDNATGCPTCGASFPELCQRTDGGPHCNPVKPGGAR